MLFFGLTLAFSVDTIELLLGAALPSMQAAEGEDEKRRLMKEVFESVLDLECPQPTPMLVGLLGSRGATGSGFSPLSLNAAELLKIFVEFIVRPARGAVADRQACWANGDAMRRCVTEV